MNEGNERGFRRRKPQGPGAEEGAARAVAPDGSTNESTVATTKSTNRAATAEQPVTPRAPTDFDGLREVADMDRDELTAMLEAFAPGKRTPFRQGQRVRGVITRLTPTIAFIGVGGKADASIDRVELPEGAAEGSTVEAYVVSTKDGEIRLARTIGGDTTRALLDDAVENKIPVQGKVESRNDHGFVVQLSGGVRAFCPNSQIDYVVEPDLDVYIGRSFSFRVLDVRGREAVVSHRAIAEIEAREASDRALVDVKEGEVYDGVVTGIREFGAFVRISVGVEGLVRLGNLAKRRVSDAASVVQEGQEVRVRVLSVDLNRKRLDLGIRQVDDTDTESAGAPRPTRREDMTTGGTFGTFGALLGGVKVNPKRK
jgi:small subunit ribosomal protein S1